MQKRMFVLIYGRSNCSYCIRAKELAIKLKKQKKNFDYQYIDIIKENISIEDLRKKIGKFINTVPQIIINNQHIGGYTDFKSYIKKT